MKLPNFFIIGAPKSASTWLAARLAQHPQIFLKLGTCYFDDPNKFRKGIGWYETFFDSVTTEQVIGEKTPTYLWGKRFDKSNLPSTVPQRIHEFAPNAKIFVTLRDPVQRAISHFHHAIRAGRISPFQSIDAILTEARHPQAEMVGLLECGLYYQQIQSWFQYFPMSRFRVVIQETDVARNPLATLQSVCEFLGVSSSFEFQGVFDRENTGLSKLELLLKYYAPPLRKAMKPLLKRLPRHRYCPKPGTIEFLANFYAEDKRKLATLLGLDLSCWEQRSSNDTQSAPERAA